MAGGARNDKDRSQGVRPDAAPEGPKRPTPTIELEAEEVVVRGGHGAGESGARAEDPTAGEHGASERESRRQERDTKAQDARGAADVPPPRVRTEPRELRGFATHLAAGLMGGLIGVLVAGYGLGLAPPGPALPEQPGDDPRIEALADRLADLEARTGSIEAEPALAPGFASRIDGLERTLAALEEAAADADGMVDSTALIARMQRLGERLDDEISVLGETLAEDRAARAELEGAVSALSRQLADLRQNVDARAAPEAGTEALARLDAFDTRLARVEQTTQSATDFVSGEQARAVALAFAVSTLRRAVDAGANHAKELAAVQALAPPDERLAVLETRAEDGIPTRDDLRRAWSDAASKVRAAEAEQAADAPTETLMDRVLASARSAIVVRRTGADAVPAAADIAARIADRLDGGDLEGIAAIGDGTTGAVRAALDPWLADVRARLEAEAILAALEADILAALSVRAGNGGPR